MFHHEKVFGEGGPNWNKVTGPMTATMATLRGYGWKVRNPDLWTTPVVKVGLSILLLAALSLLIFVAGSVSAHLWKVASLFWEGKGLATGLDTSATLVHHR